MADLSPLFFLEGGALFTVLMFFPCLFFFPKPFNIPNIELISAAAEAVSHVTKQGSSSEYECWCRCVSIYRKERGFEGPVEGHQQYKGQYLNLGLITQAVIVEIVKRSF